MKILPKIKAWTTDRKNDGLEHVYFLSNMAMLGIYLKFRECSVPT